MESTVSDLSSQIADVEARLRQIANHHPWLCLAIPPRTGKYGWPSVGEKVGPAAPQFGFPVVRNPRQAWQEPIVDSVNTLIGKAENLLFAVLEGRHVIPDDIVQDIREWEKQCHGFGWVRWLWFTTRVQHVHRYENYAQGAADAMLALGAVYRPEQQPPERLHLDLQTQRVTLDGTPHLVDDPKAFAVYEAIVKACPEPHTQLDSAGKVRGCKGEGKVRALYCAPKTGPQNGVS